MGIDEARGTLLHGMVRKGLMKDVMCEKDLNEVKKPAVSRVWGRSFQAGGATSTKALRLDLFDVFRAQAKRPVWLL